MRFPCGRCEGTGFLNLDQCPNDIREKGTDAIFDWIELCRMKVSNRTCYCTGDDFPCGNRVHNAEWTTDCQVCDCCGDGNDWYDEPGLHNEENGGIVECL